MLIREQFELNSSQNGFENQQKKNSNDLVDFSKTGTFSEENFGYMYQYISRKYSRIDDSELDANLHQKN